MNPSRLTDPTWQQVTAYDDYIAAFGACFLAGFALILLTQIFLVILHARDLARRSDARPALERETAGEAAVSARGDRAAFDPPRPMPFTRARAHSMRGSSLKAPA